MDAQKLFLAQTLQGAINAKVVEVDDIYRHIPAATLAEHVPSHILWTVITEGMAAAGLGFSGDDEAREKPTFVPSSDRVTRRLEADSEPEATRDLGAEAEPKLENKQSSPPQSDANLTRMKTGNFVPPSAEKRKSGPVILPKRTTSIEKPKEDRPVGNHAIDVTADLDAIFTRSTGKEASAEDELPFEVSDEDILLTDDTPVVVDDEDWKKENR